LSDIIAGLTPIFYIIIFFSIIELVSQLVFSRITKNDTSDEVEKNELK